MKGRWSLAAGLLLGLAGCRSTATPDLMHPGTQQAQQARALRYDPYAVNETGAPPMTGTGPREYDKPPPEPSRARWELAIGDSRCKDGTPWASRRA